MDIKDVKKIMDAVDPKKAGDTKVNTKDGLNEDLADLVQKVDPNDPVVNRKLKLCHTIEQVVMHMSPKEITGVLFFMEEDKVGFEEAVARSRYATEQAEIFQRRQKKNKGD